ncbi:MAG TPA: hypothetical protein VF160_08080 [Candidatus Dormibacteraeota bacterium]
MQYLALAAVLNRAADYLDAHGLRSGSWGSPGGAVCMDAALAIALDRDPAALGRMWFVNPVSNPTLREVGEVILASGILDQLPVPAAEPGARRRLRPAVMDARRAVIELAAWSDAPGRTAATASAALRAQAVALMRTRTAKSQAPRVRELLPALA